MILLLAAALAAPGCRGKTAPAGEAAPPAKASSRAVSVSVLADPVLSEPLGAVAKLLKKRDGIELRLSYLDSTAQAALKPASAPEADVFLFADHGVLPALVKAGMANLMKKALAEKARVALFGHTHLPLIQDLEGVLLVNPGTLSNRGSSKSYALLTIHNGSVTARLITLPPAD